METFSLDRRFQDSDGVPADVVATMMGDLLGDSVQRLADESARSSQG